MYAVIKTGGKQYRVSKGQKLNIEKLEHDAGAHIEFEQVLMVANEGTVNVGSPFINGAKVKATVVEHGRHKKVRIVKFRRRKHHDKMLGHRQYYTRVEITEING